MIGEQVADVNLDSFTYLQPVVDVSKHRCWHSVTYQFGVAASQTPVLNAEKSARMFGMDLDAKAAS